MANYYFTIPNSVTLPTDGNKVSLTTACELHRDDSALPNALTVAAGAYNVFLADTPGTGTATAADVTAPTLLSTVPADNATDIAIGTTIDLVFSETVVLGTGNIVLRDNDGGFADLETFNAATGTGDNGGTLTLVTTTETNDTVRITPGANLANSIEHAVQVAATAVDDTSGNSFAGIADDTTVSFTTAAAAASAPAVVGYNEVTPTLYSNEITVPLPAGTVAGQPVIILLTGSWTPASPTTPTDWTALPVQAVFNSASSIGCWVIPYYRNAVTSGEVSSGVTIALGANNDVSAVSVSLDSGTIGASGKTADDLGTITSLAAPTIAVDPGSTTIVFYVFSQRSLTAPSPAADYFHMPDSKSSSKIIAVYAFEDEAGPNNTALTATFPGVRAGAYSIEVEAA